MTVACQALLSMGFPRQECWTGLLVPSSEDLPDLAMGPSSPALAGGFFTAEPLGKPMCDDSYNLKLLSRKQDKI